MGITKSKKGLALVLFFILLSFFDLVYPSKGDDVNRIVPQIGRAIFFGVMISFLLSIRLKGYKIPKPILGKAINYLIVIFGFISLLHLELIFDNFFAYIKVFYWITGFYFFYSALVTGLIQLKHLEYFVVAAVIIYFLSVIRDYSNRNLWVGSKDFFVSNNAYHLLKLFPLVLLFQNKVKNILILLIAIGIIISFKRGALLAFCVGFLIYYLYILFRVKEKKILKLALGIGIILIGFYYFSLNMDVFLTRVEDFESVETAGSGRGKMFGLILNEMFTNDNILVIFFGNGFYATLDFFQKTIGHSIVAHSDVLEFLFNYGILGLTAVIYFYYKVYMIFKFYKRTYYGLVMLIWLVVIGLGSSYSVNLFAPEMIYAIIPIIILEANRIWIIRNANNLILPEKVDIT